MNAAYLRKFHLQGYIFVSRLGWSRVMAAILCVAGGVVWLTAIPVLRADLTANESELIRVKQSLQQPAGSTPLLRVPSADERAAAFYEALGNQQDSEQHIKILFALAKKTGLALNQAEYKWNQDKNGNYYTYQIQLPVNGNYSAIREFCELALLVLPYISLDEVHFKRDAVGKSTPEAKLRFTLYLSDKPLPAQASPPQSDMPGASS